MLNPDNKLNLPEHAYGNTGWRLTVAAYSPEYLKIALVDDEGERVHSIRITPEQLEHVFFASDEDEDLRDDLFLTQDDAVTEEVLIAVVTEAKKGRPKAKTPQVELIDFYELALALRENGQF